MTLGECGKMSRVYVVQAQGKHDLSPARKWGEINVLLPKHDQTFTPEVTLTDLREGLTFFNFKEDWLLMTGDPVGIALAGLVIAELRELPEWRDTGMADVLPVLKWNKRENDYIPIKIPLA